MRFSLLLAALLAIGCAGKGTKPEDCPKEYAHTMSHCAKPKPRPPQPDCIPVKKDGRPVGCIDRKDLWRLMQIQGPRMAPPVVNR